MDAEEVPLQWTAGRPRQRMFAVRLSAALAIIVLFGSAWLLQQDPPTLGVIYIGLVVMIVLARLDTAHTYRVTAIGLERRTNRWGPTTRTHFTWETFTGFSVTANAIVLHRPFLRPDVRWSRADSIQTEPAIIESLTDRLDRRT